MPGILSSKIGHLGDSEIVEVEYDPQQTNLQQMVSALQKQSSFYSVVLRDENALREVRKRYPNIKVKLDTHAPSFVESKHSLRKRHPDLYYLNLSEEQALILNSWSYFGGPMPDVLTQEQKTLQRQLKARLISKRPHELNPKRDAEGLKRYTRELLKWLAN